MRLRRLGNVCTHVISLGSLRYTKSMITVLTGENSYDVAQALEALAAGFDGTPERIDGEALQLADLPDLLMGATLFSSRRLVIIKDLASNTAVWNELPDWLGRVNDDSHIVLVEAKPDKRTRTYKQLKAEADLREFAPWKEGDLRTADQWVKVEAVRRGMTLDASSVTALVGQTGAEQWQLHYALEKLAVLDAVTPEVIRQVIDRTPHDNVFTLLDLALKGKRAEVREMLGNLEKSEEAYRLFGLLATQVTQLAAVAVSDRPPSELAAALGVHPYALSKVQATASRLGRSGARRLVRAFAAADHQLKTGSSDPWLLIEIALMQCAASS